MLSGRRRRSSFFPNFALKILEKGITSCVKDLSEYTSGADYDAQYGNLYKSEIGYLKRLALEQGGAILDVGCGTGIVTVPLAETGLETVGIDLTEAMLERAKGKARGKNNLLFCRVNALEFELDTRFALAIMTGNAFQQFLSEKEIRTLLANIHNHLQQGGLLVFDTRLPKGYDLSLDKDFRFYQTYIDLAGQNVRYFDKQVRYNADTGLLYFEMKREYASGRERRSSETIKFTPLETLLTLIQESGFEVMDVYRNWELEPFETGAANGVFKVRKA